MIIVIFYVLFVDDIVAMTKAYKNHGLFEGIGISKMVVLAIFILEFLIQIFAMRREYPTFLPSSPLPSSQSKIFT